MKILRVESWKESIPLRRPYTIAKFTVRSVDLCFVRLVTDALVTGVGSAAPVEGITGESLTACRSALRSVAPGLLEGEDPRHLGAQTAALRDALPDAPAARAALDMALYDLFARHLGVPVVDLLGRRHGELATSITIGILPVAETLAQAEEYTGRGFTCLKVKIGHDIDEDIERLTRLREVYGSDIRIRVDANEGYSLEDTRRLFASVPALDVEFVEQPLPATAPDAIRGLPEASRRKLALDESVHDEGDAFAMLREPKAGGIIVIKLMKSGGISTGMGIARVAELAGADLMWGCMDESLLSITAALHAAYAAPATRYLDLDGSFDLSRDPASEGFRLEKGCLRLPDAAGLGVCLPD